MGPDHSRDSWSDSGDRREGDPPHDGGSPRDQPVETSEGSGDLDGASDADDVSKADGVSDADAIEEDGDQPSINELFELLSSPGNRYTLTYVVRADGPVPYADLVEYVVDMVGTPEDVSTADFRNRVAARLVHSNLPKLDDAGMIEYDKSNNTIAATERTETAVPYLELAVEQSLDP